MAISIKPGGICINFGSLREKLSNFESAKVSNQIPPGFTSKKGTPTKECRSLQLLAEASGFEPELELVPH